MAPYIPPLKEPEFAYAETSPSSLGRAIFRIVRWITYAGAILTLVLALHKTPPPPVETSPQAAARAERKLEEVHREVADGRPATLRMDQSELNSYLSSHLEWSGGDTAKPAPPAEQQGPSDGAGPTPQDVERVRSNVRDVKIQLVDDRVKAYVVFDVHARSGREAEASATACGFAHRKRRSRRRLPVRVGESDGFVLLGGMAREPTPDCQTTTTWGRLGV